MTSTSQNIVYNRPFPSSLVPLFQNESKCETFHMKMSSACSFIFMHIKVIFIRTQGCQNKPATGPRISPAILNTPLGMTSTSQNIVYNRPFPSSLVPLFQNESKCETFHMKMSSACSFIFMHIKVIFIRTQGCQNKPATGPRISPAILNTVPVILQMLVGQF